MRKTFIWASLVVAFLIWVGFTLSNNKKKAIENLPKVDRGAAVSITVATVERKALQQPISLVGTVNPNAEIDFYGETSGRVIAVNGKLGDYLPAGAVFVQVDNELAKAAQALAKANLEKAQKDLERYLALRRENVGTDQQRDNLALAVEAAEAELIQADHAFRNTLVRMPFGGVIAERYVEVGSYITPGPPSLLARVVDISRLKVRVEVAEGDVFRLKVGDGVEVTTSVHAGQVYKGTVYAIGAQADAAHNYPVDVLVANSTKYPLKAGMFARVTFTSLKATEGLVIPRDALVGSTKDAKVYIIRGNKASLAPVQVSAEVGDKLVITSGLQQGDQVAVTGLLNLYEDAAVQIIAQ